jgi:hypothetical protein
MSDHPAIAEILRSNLKLQILYCNRSARKLSDLSSNITNAQACEEVVFPSTICFALINTVDKKIIASVEIIEKDANAMLYGINASPNSKRFRAFTFLATEFNHYARRNK